MNKNISKGKTGCSGAAFRFVVSVVVPALFLLAFLGNQVVRFDNVGWANGFNHPLTGWDHLVTMLAVGIWAAQLRGQAIWILPLAFVGVMSLGGIAGAAGIAIPSVEGIILLSCAVFSVLITRRIRFSSKFNVMIVAFFAFFHGFAHGQEISASAGLISYTLGFMLATLLLHGAGILAAKLVILCVASLLGLIFANSALAKEGYSSPVSDQGLFSSTAAEKDGQVFFDAGRFHLKDRCLSVSEPPDLKSYAANKSAGARCRESIYRAEGFSQLERGPDKQYFESLTGQEAGFGIASASDQRLLASDLGLFVSDLAGPFVALSLWFNALYPDINNTPGLLLSNGVGLTSPPIKVAQCAKISHTFEYSRCSRFSAIEAIQLQYIFILITVGDLLSRSIAFDAAYPRAVKHLKYLIPNRIQLPNSLRLPWNYRLDVNSAIESGHCAIGLICNSTWVQVLRQPSVEFISQWAVVINLTKNINYRRTDVGSE